MFKLYKKADILKQQLEGLVSCEDVQIVER